MTSRKDEERGVSTGKGRVGFEGSVNTEDTCLIHYPLSRVL